MHIVFSLIGGCLLLLGVGALLVSTGMAQAGAAGVAVTGAILLVGGVVLNAMEDIRRQVKDLTLIVVGQCKAPEAGRLNSDQTDQITSAVKRTYRP